jgi:hypothetical protein
MGECEGENKKETTRKWKCKDWNAITLLSTPLGHSNLVHLPSPDENTQKNQLLSDEMDQ